MKIYEKQTERYTEAYNEFVRKQLAKEIPTTEKAPKAPTMPQDRTKTYDRYISMYGMTKIEDIYLYEQSFAQFMLDDWDFVRQHVRHLQFLSTMGTESWLNDADNTRAGSAMALYAGS